MSTFRRSSCPRLGSAALITTLVTALALFPSFGGAQAQEQKEEMVEITVDRLEVDSFPVDDEDPEKHVPTPEQAMRSPLRMGYFVMLLAEKGAKASADHEFKKAVKYYRAMVKAVPERARGYALLCQAYEDAGELDEAIQACKTALGKASVTVDDNLRYVALLLNKPDTLSPTEVEDVEAVIAHLEKELSSDKATPAVINQLKCDLATRLEDVQRLRACSTKLKELAPDDAKTTVFSWALLVMERDFAGAQRIIETAARKGMPAEAVAKMQSGLLIAKERATGQVWYKRWALPLGGAAVLAAVLVALYFYLRHKRIGLGAVLRNVRLPARSNRA